jgi:hypothetical protein
MFNISDIKIGSSRNLSEREYGFKKLEYGYVYIFRIGNEFKVGSTNDPLRRFYELTQSAPNGIYIYLLRSSNYRDLEREILKLYKDIGIHINRECFYYNDNILNYLSKYSEIKFPIEWYYDSIEMKVSLKHLYMFKIETYDELITYWNEIKNNSDKILSEYVIEKMDRGTHTHWKFIINKSLKNEIEKFKKIDNSYLKYTMYENNNNIIGFIIINIPYRISYMSTNFNKFAWSISNIKEIMNSKNDNLTTVIEDSNSRKRIYDSLKFEKIIYEQLKKHPIKNSIKNNIRNINTNSYMNPSLDHLNINDYIECIKKEVDCIPSLIEKIYFNTNVKENHSIYIPDVKRSYIIIYDKNKWKTHIKKTIIRQLIIICDDNIRWWFEKLKTESDVKDELDLIEKCIQNQISIRSDEQIQKQINAEIQLLLFNNKSIPMLMENVWKLSDQLSDQ